MTEYEDGLSRSGTAAKAPDILQNGYELASSIAAQYAMDSLNPLLASTREALAGAELSIAVLGRFKAGKSSFLNRLFGRDLLPTGVVPVTSVITEIRYGPVAAATVFFEDGRHNSVPLEEIRAYIAEAENPGNRKRVSRVSVELPAIERFRPARFVDTPGLESAHAHNTRASLDWLPKVGVALVAVGVDPPLSQQDLDLLRAVYEYTPHVAILLTKADLLTRQECAEVRDFVAAQIAKYLGKTPSIYPYSIRPGFEALRAAVEDKLIRETTRQAASRRRELIATKVGSALKECEQYLGVALRAAETLEQHRRELHNLVSLQRTLLEDLRTQLRIVAQHTIRGMRTHIESALSPREREISRKLLAELDLAFPAWSSNIASASKGFETWIADAVSEEMRAISTAYRQTFLALAEAYSAQCTRLLQDFRNRISDEVERVLGVPLRTSEVKMDIAPPSSPDVRVGKIFDHNWEVFSWLIPMAVFGPSVRRHFRARVPDIVFKNLSRLTSQWEEPLCAAVVAIGNQAEDRAGRLLETIERLLSGQQDGRSRIAADIDRVRTAQACILAAGSLPSAAPGVDKSDHSGEQPGGKQNPVEFARRCPREQHAPVPGEGHDNPQRASNPAGPVQPGRCNGVIAPIARQGEESADGHHD